MAHLHGRAVAGATTSKLLILKLIKKVDLLLHITSDMLYVPRFEKRVPRFEIRANGVY